MVKESGTSVLTEFIRPCLDLNMWPCKHGVSTSPLCYPTVILFFYLATLGPKFPTRPFCKRCKVLVFYLILWVKTLKFIFYQIKAGKIISMYKLGCLTIIVNSRIVQLQTYQLFHWYDLFVYKLLASFLKCNRLFNVEQHNSEICDVMSTKTF